MRRNHIAAILLLSLFSWLVVIFIFLKDPSSSKQVSEEAGEPVEGLRLLETRLQQEVRANEALVDGIKRVIHARPVETSVEEQNEEPVEKKEDYDARLREVAQRNGATAVLVLSCNRVTVTRCINQLLKYRPSAEQFPIVVSQDCRHRPTAEAIRAYIPTIFHIEQPDQSEIAVPPKEKKFKGYFKIARHYGWALNQIFTHYNFSNAIVIEDDLDISPDLFGYFSATLPLLKADPSLWCVSAWNDNGKVDLVDTNAPALLHRTDFFPGLGWMLTQQLWAELSQKWPPSYWDDWIRQPEQRKNRSCIRPEISRTKTFGKIGVSNGMFYEKHLKFIHLNDKPVEFTQYNLSYLLKDNYDEVFVRSVYESPVVSHLEVRGGSAVPPDGPMRIPYHDKSSFRAAAKSLGLMDDFRSGVPRTGYRGVVSFFYKGRRVYLAPSWRWRGYDPSFR